MLMRLTRAAQRTTVVKHEEVFPVAASGRHELVCGGQVTGGEWRRLPFELCKSKYHLSEINIEA